VLADLGVPRERGPALEPRARWLEVSDAASWLEARAPSAHKGRSGRVVIVAARRARPELRSCRALRRLRSGRGLVTILHLCRRGAQPRSAVVEVMTEALDPERPLATLERALEGAGRGRRGARARPVGSGAALRRSIVLKWPGRSWSTRTRSVLFAGRGQELAGAAGNACSRRIPGELGRLLGVTAAVVESDRSARSSRPWR
jgi:NAD(P)H-hydrate epimerase